MARPKLTPLQRQVTRAQRRLAAQSILNSLTWCWVAGILGLAVWFLVQPLVLDQPPGWIRWGVAGSLLGIFTIVGIARGWLRAPTRLAAALSLDSKFGLKERVTTSLTLTREQEATAAGQALLADVADRIKDLDVRSRFPVSLSWSAGLVPLCAGIFAFIVVF